MKLARFVFVGLCYLLVGSICCGNALAADTIKVGVLHSLSGTMAISETTLKDTMLMLIAEQNRNGGLLGKKLEAVVVDPASDWPLFAEKARELIEKKKVAAVFGCWTSVSRKSVLPVFEELNSLLFYPVQYEGEESSKNVFYTGAAPNPADLASLAEALADACGPGFPAEEAARAALEAVRGYAALVRRDERAIRALRGCIEHQDRFWGQIPELPDDVHDLPGVAQVASAIFPEEDPPRDEAA